MESRKTRHSSNGEGDLSHGVAQAQGQDVTEHIEAGVSAVELGGAVVSGQSGGGEGVGVGVGVKAGVGVGSGVGVVLGEGVKIKVGRGT